MTNPPSSSKDNQSSILKDTRQHKGISLEMVHEATKIPLDALKAIEQGYSVHRLPPFYYRGFIRIYSKYLELDESKVLASYGIAEVVSVRPPPVVAPRESKPKARTTPQAIPADNFVKDTLRPLLKRNLTAARLEQAGKLLVFVVAIVFAFKLVGCIVHKGKPQPASLKVEKKIVEPASAVKPVKEKAKSKKDEARKEETRKEEAMVAARAEHAMVDKKVVASVVPPPIEDIKPDAKTVKTDTKPAETKADAKTDKKSKRIELTVRATKAGWLQVNADGQIVFQSILKKGDAETWSASDEIELSGKNINLLEFELNGKMLGALGPSDRGAKRVVFTKDGLSVKK
jgi:cytoskeletal protein RodZ